MAGRWDHLFDQKPIPLLEHLKLEVAKLLAQELTQWPPPLDELEPSFRERHASVFAPDARRPSNRVYAEAFALTRWELERNIEAVDEYMRNERFLERGVSAADKSALIVLSRWLLEQMLGLSEATENRVKRRDLLEVLDELERRMGLKLLVN